MAGPFLLLRLHNHVLKTDGQVAAVESGGQRVGDYGIRGHMASSFQGPETDRFPADLVASLV
jgi:hypothetical protein